MLNIIVIVVVVLIFISIFRSSATLDTILSHWHHRFETPPFSPQDFYTEVKDKISKRELDKLAVSKVTYSQGGFLSPSREYLRIKYKEFIYDICAAPFGKEFFVSWWLGETGNSFQDFLKNIPVIGPYLTSPKRKKTFYELDTEIMFKEAVTSCVREAIESLTVNKGVRELSDKEWHYQNHLVS